MSFLPAKSAKFTGMLLRKRSFWFCHFCIHMFSLWMHITIHSFIYPYILVSAGKWPLIYVLTIMNTNILVTAVPHIGIDVIDICTGLNKRIYRFVHHWTCTRFRTLPTLASLCTRSSTNGKLYAFTHSCLYISEHTYRAAHRFLTFLRATSRMDC